MKMMSHVLIGLLVFVVGMSAGRQMEHDSNGGQDVRAVVRQANERQGEYLRQVTDLQAQIKSLNERIASDNYALEQLKQKENEVEAMRDGCVARFRTGTIILEPRPVAALPVAHGLFSVAPGPTLEAIARQVGVKTDIETPVLYVPAQVEITSRLPGVAYEWIDPNGGQVKAGPFAARQKP